MNYGDGSSFEVPRGEGAIAAREVEETLRMQEPLDASVAHLRESLAPGQDDNDAINNGISTPLLLSYAPEVTSARSLKRSASAASNRLTPKEKKQLLHMAMHPQDGNQISIDFRLVSSAYDPSDEDEPYATDALKIAEEVELDVEAEDFHARHLLDWPGACAPLSEKFLFVFNFPFNAVVHFTIPFQPYYLCAVIATLWLAAISFLLSVLSERFGQSLLIPNEAVGKGNRSSLNENEINQSG